MTESNRMTYFMEKGDSNIEAPRARERDEHERRYHEEDKEHDAHGNGTEDVSCPPRQEEGDGCDHTRGDEQAGCRGEKESVLCHKVTKVCVGVPALVLVEKNTLPIPRGED